MQFSRPKEKEKNYEPKFYVQYFKGHKIFPFFKPNDTIMSEETKMDMERNQYNTLMLHYSIQDVHRGFLVKYESSIKKGYMLFSNHLDFYYFVSEPRFFRREERCFFEVMWTPMRKPHFDIDIPLEKILHFISIGRVNLGKPRDFSVPLYITEDEWNQEIQQCDTMDKLHSLLERTICKAFHITIHELDVFLLQTCEKTIGYIIKACIEIFAEYNVVIQPEKHFIVCTSHGGKMKKSAHITIDHFAHTDHVEAKSLYTLVHLRLAEEIRPWVDSSVYTSVRNWRIVGNQKFGSGREKIFQHTWKYFNEKDQFISVSNNFDNKFHTGNLAVHQFEGTLLTPFSSTILPNFSDRAGEYDFSIRRSELILYNGIYTDSWDDGGQGDPETLKRVYELIAEQYEEFGSAENVPLEVHENRKFYITFKKKRNFTCRVCNKIHENQNPYIAIRRGHAYMNCRRSMANLGVSKSLYLGKVYEYEEEESNIKDKENENENEEDDIFMEIKRKRLAKQGGNLGEKRNTFEPKNEKMENFLEKNTEFEAKKNEKKVEKIRNFRKKDDKKRIDFWFRPKGEIIADNYEERKPVQFEDFHKEAIEKMIERGTKGKSKGKNAGNKKEKVEKGTNVSDWNDAKNMNMYD